MSTAELKLDVINRITSLKDANILSQIKKLLDFEIDTKVYKLSDEQKAILDNRLQESENSYLTAEDSLKKLNKKYGL